MLGCHSMCMHNRPQQQVMTIKCRKLSCTMVPGDSSQLSSEGNFTPLVRWEQQRKIIHTAGEGGSGYCFRCEEISPVPVWPTIFYPFGPQATPTHLQGNQRSSYHGICSYSALGNTTWRLRLYDCLSSWRAACECRSVQPPSTAWNVPTPPETILDMIMLSSSPVTAAQIKQWTAPEGTATVKSERQAAQRWKLWTRRWYLTLPQGLEQTLGPQWLSVTWKSCHCTTRRTREGARLATRRSSWYID